MNEIPLKYNPKTDLLLPHQYKPRWYQEDFFKALELGYRRFDLVWHRRAGKDISIINATTMAMAGEHPVTRVKSVPYAGIGTYYYFFPTFAQGKKVIWDGMTKEGIRFLDFIPEKIRYQTWSDEMKIRLLNGSLFQIIGTDNFDAIMGTNPIWCVFSEFALQNPKAWEYIRPILTENKGIAIFPYTPRGRNHAYRLHCAAEVDKKFWFSQVLPVNITNAITREDIEQDIKDGMSEELVEQEYYCSFMQGIEGSYYAKYIQKARDDGRILDVPLDATREVHTAWDIGGFTAIIFFQIYPTKYHIIDYYENQGESIQHCAKVLQDKGYVYGNHYAPHDIKAKQWVSEGLPRIQVAREHGIFFQPQQKLHIHDGIEAGRNIFSLCYFDETKTRLLIKRLENYSKTYNKAEGYYGDTPKSDQHSHGADAWRTFAVAHKSQNIYRQYNDEEDSEYLIKHCSKYSGL